SGPVAGPEQAQPDAEVGVVVHRVELQDLLELRPGGLDPLGAEVGPGQGLPDRSLLRFEVAGPLQGDDGGMGVPAVEQPAAFLEAGVGLPAFAAVTRREAVGTCARTGHGARPAPLSR